MKQTTLFNGYTKQEENAIYQTVKPLVKVDADWEGILFEINTLVVDVCEGHSHPESLMYLSQVEDRYSDLIEAYEKLGELLRWDLDDALGRRLPDVLVTRMSALAGQTTNNQVSLEWEEWAALVEKETGEHIDLSDVDIPLTQQLHHLNVQKGKRGGRTKNYVMRLLVRDLMDIFENATGTEPIIYQSNDGRGYAGSFYPFAVACLAPAFPETTSQLGSPILTAYRELKTIAKTAPSPVKV